MGGVGITFNPIKRMLSEQRLSQIISNNGGSSSTVTAPFACNSVGVSGNANSDGGKVTNRDSASNYSGHATCKGITSATTINGGNSTEHAKNFNGFSPCPSFRDDMTIILAKRTTLGVSAELISAMDRVVAAAIISLNPAD